MTKQSVNVGFGRFAEQKSKPRDALARILPYPDYTTSDPIRDPLSWKNPEEYERSRLTRAIIRYVEEGFCAPEDLRNAFAVDHGQGIIVFPDGSKIGIVELLENQRRACYNLLKQGVDVRTISSKIGRDEAWVEKLRREFFA